MKVVEIMKIGRKTLELLQKSCIRTGDVRYLGMYDEFKQIRRDGGKSSYAAAILSEKYKISERTVYYLIRKFEKDCNVDIV